MKFPRALIALLLAGLLLTGCSTMAADNNGQAVENGQFMKRTVMVDGEKRTYQVFVPASHSTKKPLPIVLFLHGSGERGSDGENLSLIHI